MARQPRERSPEPEVLHLLLLLLCRCRAPGQQQQHHLLPNSSEPAHSHARGSGGARVHAPVPLTCCAAQDELGSELRTSGGTQRVVLDHLRFLQHSAGARAELAQRVHERRELQRGTGCACVVLAVSWPSRPVWDLRPARVSLLAHRWPPPLPSSPVARTAHHRKVVPEGRQAASARPGHCLRLQRRRERRPSSGTTRRWRPRLPAQQRSGSGVPPWPRSMPNGSSGPHALPLPLWQPAWPASGAAPVRGTAQVHGCMWAWECSCVRAVPSASPCMAGGRACGRPLMPSVQGAGSATCIEPASSTATHRAGGQAHGRDLMQCPACRARAARVEHDQAYTLRREQSANRMELRRMEAARLAAEAAAAQAARVDADTVFYVLAG